VLYGDLLVYVALATAAIEPDMVTSSGELGRDVSHQILCSTQAASRAEQRADIAESFISRAVHDSNKPFTSE